jgi:hypothetical protein
MPALPGRSAAIPPSLARGDFVRVLPGARLLADDGPPIAPPGGLPAVYIGRVGLSTLALVVTAFGRTLVERRVLEVAR